MTTKSFIKTIGEKGLLADYNTSGKKLQTELTAGDNITIGGNIISSDQLFVATYGTTSYSDVKAAYEAGKICMVKNGDSIAQIYAVTSNNIRFIMNNPVTKSALSYQVDTNNTWSTVGYVAQEKLTFDTTPTAGSNNPVTSDGVANINGYKKLFSQGTVSSTASDSIILFYVKWKSPNDSGIYNRQYEINYTNFKTGTSGSIKISPNITNPTGGGINLVSDRFNFNDISFGVIEAPDGDSNHPYWFVGYGYGVGGSIEIMQNGRKLTYTDRLVVVPKDQILTSSCNFTKTYSEKPKYYTYTLYPPTTGTFILKSIDGAIRWVAE